MRPYVIQTHGQLARFIDREFLLTNGTGAFAGSTIVGCNTRRYHSLLMAATVPPVGRIATVNRIGEILRLDGKRDMLELSINQFPGTNNFHPRGEQYLTRFELDHTARWFYDVDGVRVRKELQLLWQRNVAVIRYQIDPAGRRVQMELLPFVALRDFHALRRGKTALEVAVDSTGCTVADGSQRVHLRCDAGQFFQMSDWWTDHVLAVETERGQDDREDLFVPGRWAIEIEGATTLQVSIGLEPTEAINFDQELARRRAAVPILPGASETVERLAMSASDFVVARKKPDGSPGVTVIAGYPWFADWGRDTMISLPGLLLSTGRHEQAASVLSVFAQYVSKGMIPNRFNDYTNEPEYNTVDASLWFVHAAFEYLRATRDSATFEKTLLPACRDIPAGFRDGTRYGIRMDPADGLITQGDPSTQLTWMDAKCNGVAFTPRQGKPVEINALWYHALRLMSAHDASAGQLADRVLGSFAPAFFVGAQRGCADVVDGESRDLAIRRNHIFAVSLANSPLDEGQQRTVVEVVRSELLTTMGLKTLSARDAKYKSRFTGAQVVRDEAYHNGTVWPWPIGAFLDAYLKVNNRSDPAKQQARAWLKPLLDHLCHDGCIGSISEVFEAGTLRPAGCCAQAWSVAEVLRLAIDLEM